MRLAAQTAAKELRLFRLTAGREMCEPDVHLDRLRDAAVVRAERARLDIADAHVKILNLHIPARRRGRIVALRMTRAPRAQVKQHPLLGEARRRHVCAAQPQPPVARAQVRFPAADELVLVSGLPPIRAQKLRYFEDRNFKERVLRAPELARNGYADRPPSRADDWSGRAAPPPVPPVAEAASLRDDGGGLQHQRHPGTAKPRRTRRHSPDQLDFDLGPDDGDPAIDAGTYGPLSPLNPVVAAHGINNEGAGHADLLPSF
jgi:hypothetical protein